MKFPSTKFSSMFAMSLLALALLITGCSSSSKQEAKAGTDAQIAGQVQAKLNSDPLLAANQRSSVGVRVQNGVATLSGWVTNDSELTAALNAAQGVEGVKQVVSRLQVGNEFAGMPDAAAAYANAPEQAEPRYAQPYAGTKPAPSRPVTKPAVRRTSPSNSNYSTPTYSTNGGVSNRGTNTASSSIGASTQPYSASGENTYSGSSSAPVSVQTVAATTPQEPIYREPQRINIPAGTEVPVRLIDTLSSETSNPDQIWRGTVNGDIVVDDHVVIPSGADVEGRIVDVKKSSHYTGAAQLTLQLSKVQFGGKSYTVASDQWTRKGAARGGNTAKKVGSGAAIGAVLGGIFGGGKGAAIGAAAGAGAGAGANTVTKGEKVELDSESLIIFRLASGVSVVPSAGRERGAYNSAPTRQYVPPASNTVDDGDRPVLKRRG